MFNLVVFSEPLRKRRVPRIMSPLTLFITQNHFSRNSNMKFMYRAFYYRLKGSSVSADSNTN